MTTATVTSKGQITIPLKVRQALSVDAGDRVEFVEHEPGQFLLLAANRSVKDLKGLFAPPRRAVSIQAMNRAIAQTGMSAGTSAAGQAGDRASKR
jgi:antitoxin PrlF